MFAIICNHLLSYQWLLPNRNQMSQDDGLPVQHQHKDSGRGNHSTKALLFSGLYWKKYFSKNEGKKSNKKVKSLHVFKSKTLTNRLWSANVISIRIRDGMEICLKALIQIPRLIFSYRCCNSNSACGRFRNQKKGTRAVGLPLAKKKKGEWGKRVWDGINL